MARRALVAGGGGALGAAVLEQLLASHHFHTVAVLASAALQPALRGLRVVADEPAALAAAQAETALVVFDRQRHANGREAAFVRPEPAELPALARRLRDAGVRVLVVVVPHTPAMLPQALLSGLASLDEAAVAAMGFDQLVFMRMAQRSAADGEGAAGFGHRLARGLLAQLHWFVPQREQPVRHTAVARVAAALAAALPASAPGVRVLGPQLARLVSQGLEPQAVVADWLAGRPLPTAPAGTSGQRW